MAERCGTCCKGSQPIRKRFDDPIVCACGAPFFSQIVVENSLPTSGRCRIGIPIDFMEDHGSKFDKTVTLQEEENMETHRVQIGGNLFVGFGFEWRDFAQAHNVGIGQVVVFTLVARSRFLVQIYKLGNPSSKAAKPNAELEQAPTVPPLVTPKVEDDDDDIIEVCAAQDWLVAKASRSNSVNPNLPSKVKAEEVFSETGSGQPAQAPDKHGRVDVKGRQSVISETVSGKTDKHGRVDDKGRQSVISETLSGQAARASDKHGRVDVKGRQKCVIVPKTENGSDGMDVSDGIVEASDSSRRKKKFGLDGMDVSDGIVEASDSSRRKKKFGLDGMDVSDGIVEASDSSRRKKKFGLDGMDVSDGIVEASDSSRRKKKFGGADFEIMHEGHPLRRSDERPVWKTPAAEEGGQASPCEGSSDNEENGESNVSSPSTSDSAWSPGKSYSPHVRKYAASGDSNTEDEEDDEDGVDDHLVLNKIAGKKRFSASGSTSLDEAKRKRSKIRSEIVVPSADDEMNVVNKNGLLVVGHIVKRHGRDWHEAGTKRGRTYVSKRRPVTEAEKAKTLDKALQVQISLPSFLKQLHKDSCYRALQLFPPAPFYKANMVSATKGSYKASLIDQEGKTWSTRIMGKKIFWKHFTLDHYLEEDDVVVFEMTDPRPESVTFLVHIFRVVDVKMTLTGKEGWAIHYNVVEGTKKQYFEEKRRLLKAQGLKKLRKQNQKKARKDGLPNPENDSGITEYFRRKKNIERSPKSQGKGKGLQEEHALDELEQQPPRSFKRPTTCLRRQEINQSSGELNTTPSKSAGSVKQEIEEAPPLASVGILIGNAVNSVTEPCVLKEVFGGEESD